MILSGAKFVGMGYNSPDAPWNQELTDAEIEAYEEEEEKEKWFDENNYEWPNGINNEYTCPNCNRILDYWMKQCQCGQNIRWE